MMIAHSTAQDTASIPPAPTLEDALSLTPPLIGLDAARAFLQHLNWPIYPADQRKKPYWADYKPLATTNEAPLTHAWRKWPHANPMSIIPPGYGVIDCDPRNGGDHNLRRLELHHSPLPPTWNDHTREQGYHLFFLLPPGVRIPPKTELAPGVELLGARHPLTIPGFVHEDGHINTWDEFLNPCTMAIATLPQWVLGLIPTGAKAHDPSSHGESLPPAEKAGTFFSSAATGGGQDFLLPTPRSLGRLSAEQIADLLRDPAIVATCLAYLARERGRQPPVLGKSFLAWFRDEQRPSAVFLPPSVEHPNVLYYDFGALDEHGRPEKGQTLPAVLYRLVNGDWPATMPKSSFLVWGARLLVESGAVKAERPPFPPLPEDAPPAAILAYRGAEVLERARSILQPIPGEDADLMPYSESFCAHWVGITERLAHDAIMWLVSRGGLLFRRLRKQCALFVRGTIRLITRLRHAPIATAQQDALRINEQAQHALAHELTSLTTDITARYGDALVDVPAVPTIEQILMELPQVCPQCGREGFALIGEGCEWCMILLPAHARTEEKRRLYGSPPLVDIPRTRGDTSYGP